MLCYWNANGVRTAQLEMLFVIFISCYLSYLFEKCDDPSRLFPDVRERNLGVGTRTGSMLRCWVGPRCPTFSPVGPPLPRDPCVMWTPRPATCFVSDNIQSDKWCVSRSSDKTQAETLGCSLYRMRQVFENK